MSDERPQCAALTQAGAQCKNRARPGAAYCHVHRAYATADQAAVEIPVIQADPSPPQVAQKAPRGSKVSVAMLTGELNALARELQQAVPHYVPPAFAPDKLLTLLQENLDKFTPDAQKALLAELRANLEGTSPKEFLDPDTWKGMWYVLNYTAQAQTAAMREKLAECVMRLPGAALVNDLRSNLEGTSPKDFLDPDTWKGMFYIVSYTAQLQADELKRRLRGDQAQEEDA